MIVSCVLLPYTVPVRKNASKMHKGSGVPLLAGSAVHFCGVPLSVGYAVHFCGVPLSVGYAVHFCGVPLSVGYAVHFCGVFAAAQKLLLVNHSASTLKPANHRPNTLRQRFKHLNHQMNMIRHHLLCKHLQGKPLRSVSLMKALSALSPSSVPKSGKRPSTGKVK